MLNEIAQARICLLDSVRKAAYDAQLRTLLDSQDASAAPAAARVKISLDSPTSVREPVRLYRPGRGPRDQGADRRLIVIASMVTLLVVALAAYRVYVRLRPPPIAELPAETIAPPAAVKPTLPPLVPHDPPESAVVVSGPPETVAPQTSTPSDTTPSPTEVTPPAVSTPDAPPAPPTAVAVGVNDNVNAATQRPGAAAERRPPARASTSPPRASSTPWDTAALKIAGTPRRFDAATPAGELLSRLANRDVVKAREVLTRWRPATGAAPVTEEIYADGALVYDAVRTFWTLVADGLAELKTGDRIHCRDYVGTVVNVSERELQLEAPTGKIESLDTRPTHISRDLAISLAAHRLRSSSSTAWRAIGVFLAIDRDGDVALSQLFSQRAEQNGVDVDFFFQALARLQGESSVPFILQADEQKSTDRSQGSS